MHEVFASVPYRKLNNRLCSMEYFIGCNLKSGDYRRNR